MACFFILNFIQNNTCMRIAQISPLIESVPPKTYGGTERIVSYITEELVKRGHEVTLYATADSQTRAHLVPICKQALRLDTESSDPLAYHFVELERVVSRADEFDILHFHVDYIHYPVSAKSDYTHITTLHGRQDIQGLRLLYKTFHNIPLISISDNQRLPLPEARWVKTIYHGLPLDLYTPGSGQGKYFAFLGRISPEKGPDRAIEIAKQAGIPLKIAAKVDKADKEYFEREIKHLLNHPLIDYIGEIGEDEKGKFLGDALALLFPVNWPEPFGLTMIEAMACGTPVIAFRAGSVPEIIDEGITGVIVSNEKKVADAVEKIHAVNRIACRKKFEERFSVKTMVDNYEQAYNMLIREKQERNKILL
jgi:glycosyltransferase involved in cell wall biosynthesis